MAARQDRRWQGPAVPTAALLLLPSLTDDVRLLTGLADWTAAAADWGIVVTAAGRQVVAHDAGRALAADADVVLLLGRDRTRRLARAGYCTTTLVARRAGAGATVLAPRGQQVADLVAPRRRRSVRALVLALAHRATASCVVLAQRPPRPPALLAQAGALGPAVLIAGGGGPRRRSVLLVHRPDGQTMALKAARLEQHSRGEAEQQVLGQLRDAGLGFAVPEPLGEGSVGGVAWTAESLVAGTPLSELLHRGADADRVRAVLTGLARWSASVAAATGESTAWSSADAARLPLHGPHRRLAVLLDGLHGVPGVLAHRDLASAHNVLVDAGRWTVIDWETARPASLPLLDVLPLLVASLAALRGHRGPQAQAAFVLRLCAGQERDSAWLLALTRAYLHDAGAPIAAAGALAGLSFGYQASMRLEHEGLVRAAGGHVEPWTTLWDDVAEQWLAHPALGRRWEALQHTADGGHSPCAC